jgi:hypothetical protein
MEIARVEDGPPKPCGAQHPKYKNVTCGRTGKCFDGHHIGIVQDKHERRTWITFESENVSAHAVFDA